MMDDLPESFPKENKNGQAYIAKTDVRRYSVALNDNRNENMYWIGYPLRYH